MPVPSCACPCLPLLQAPWVQRTPEPKLKAQPVPHGKPELEYVLEPQVQWNLGWAGCPSLYCMQSPQLAPGGSGWCFPWCTDEGVEAWGSNGSLRSPSKWGPPPPPPCSRASRSHVEPQPLSIAWCPSGQTPSLAQFLCAQQRLSEWSLRSRGCSFGPAPLQLSQQMTTRQGQWPLESR